MKPLRNHRETTESLLKWYDAHKKNLPWRGTVDPYRVWLGEVMSQQTTLKVVVPRYGVLLERLPDVRALALCPEEELRGLWSGLGYYARARNLKKGAAHIVGELKGHFPSDCAHWQKIPGVGAYTAAIVSSICNGEPTACIDGNVIRVASRLASLSSDVWTSSGQEAIRKFAQSLVETTARPGDANQALMELGQTVCRRSRPACLFCPLKSSCGAFHLGVVEQCPPPKPRSRSIPVDLTVVIPVRQDGAAVAVGRRGGRFLRTIPGFALHEESPTAKASTGLVRHHPVAGTFKHAITRHRITARCCLGELMPGVERVEEAELTARLGLKSLDWIPIEKVASNLGSSLDTKAWSHSLEAFETLWKR